MQSILVVEDDLILNNGVCFNLEMEGYHAISADSIEKAKEQYETREVNLLLVDVNLPDGNGMELARWVREQSKVPIVFLTARDMDEDMVSGFEAGADDYITKPFNTKVLLQRIQAVLRRCEESNRSGAIVKCGNLEIDIPGYRVLKSGKELTLTPTEYKLLFKFCKNSGIVLTRQQILAELWDEDENYVDEHTLTINISRLRSKISDKEYSYIKTIYGVGYQWTGEKDG